MSESIIPDAEKSAGSATGEPPAIAVIRTSCCVVGGGPAGMMLGLLLARAGVEVTVLEKHGDFLRDFRGDTIHPSTLEVLHELGLLQQFLALPHQEARELGAYVVEQRFPIADFAHLRARCRFIAFIPQWDFLDFLAQQAVRYPGFALRMRTEAVGLLEEAETVVGVLARGPEGSVEIRAPLVVAAAGRHSLLRDAARLPVQSLGAPMDVLWFRLPRRPDDFGEVALCFRAGRILVLIDRRDYWQCGYVIPKGSAQALRTRGIEALRSDITRTASFLGDRTDELRDWDSVSLLAVRVDRLGKWYRDGILCIGDAAHAMSPVGGVGINLAVQDAVAAANVLADALRDGRPVARLLRKLQRRRELPARLTQRLQVAVQNRIISRVLESRGRLEVPLPVRLLARFPVLRRIPARLIGVGVRPEHVTTRSAGSVRPGPRDPDA